MKKTVLLLSLALLSFIYAAAQTATAPSGSGASGDPYLIANLNNLYWVTQNTASWATGKFFKQTADIDASTTSSWTGGAGLPTIGNGTTTFSGNYDGQGYAISGLFINLPTTDNIGFFGKLSGNLTIQNIRLINMNIKGQGNVGGLVGSKWDGSNNTSTISNCSTTGVVVGTGSSVGGMFGCLGNSAAVNVIRCFSTCTVSTSATSGQNNYGGLAGYVKGANTTFMCKFTDCYATGNVSSNGGAGGFIGGVSTVTANTIGTWSATNCYSSGLVAVSGTSGGNFGGFIGRILNSATGTISNCYWDNQSSGQATSLFGTAKTTALMTTQSSYTGWDFVDETTNGTNDYWVIVSGVNNGYPVLTWPSPVNKAATNIATKSFTANWASVPTTNWTPAPALTYLLDVATDAAFTSVLTGYNSLSVSGNAQEVSGLSEGTTYYYRTRYVYNGLSESANSNITTLITVPAAVLATAATNTTTSGFTANWDAVTGAAKYQLEVATDAEFTTIVYNNSLIIGTSCAVIGLSTNAAYYYRIRSCNADGAFSANSNTISANTLAGLAIPVAIAASNIGTGGFTAGWITSPGAIEYRLDVATNSTFTDFVTGYNNLVVIGTSQVVTGLAAGTTCYYRVRAYDGSSSSENSNIITLATMPEAPMAATATNITTTGFVAGWASVAGAEGYLLDVSTNSGFTSFITGYNNKSVAGTSQTLTGLTAGTTYYYRVRATNGAVSATSNTITVTTTKIYPTIPFPNFVVYPEGTSSAVYNAGPGMALDQTAVTTEDSKMVVISSTTGETFAAYIQSLLANGFTQVATSTIDKNVFYTLKNNNQLYYLYFTASKNQVRIIQDKSSRTLLSELDTQALGTGTTEFYLYSLDYTHGEGQTSTTDYWKIDCGAMLIVKLADNSLFIIDSGHQRQGSNAALEGLLNFMYKITGQTAGTTLDIRGWFFSHAHGDHVYSAYPFLEKYHDVLNVESVLFNIPSFQVMGGGYDAGTFPMKQTFNTYYPNCKYVKLHTGQNFSLQGVSFDVFHTHEDGVASTGINAIGDFNDTSTLLRMTLGGKKFMLLADAGGLCQTDMVSMYTAATLRSDCVQTSHHGYNDLTSLFAAIASPVALFCNSRQNVGLNSGAYLGVINATSNVKVVFADPDTYKITVENGSIKTVTIPSYRSYFKTVTLPTLTVGTITTTGNKTDLNTVLKETSLASQVIDKSVTGTAGNLTESCSLILDGTTATKFCSTTIPATIAWTMKSAVTLKWYVIYSANDNATRLGRNPQKWVLSASNNGTSWTNIDSVNNPLLPETNFTGTAFSITNPVPYQYYALKVFSTDGSDVLQFSEIGLYGTANAPTAIINPVDKKEQSILINANANNQIRVNYSGSLSTATTVTVYNITGQKLLTKRIINSDTLLTVPAPGIYIVDVKNAQTSITKKVRLY